MKNKIRYMTLFIVAGLLMHAGCFGQQAGEAGGTEFKLYFLGGQSNMEGFGFNKDLPSDLNSTFENVMIFQGNHVPDNDESGGNGVWEQLQPGHGTGYTSNGIKNVHSDRFGPELSFGAWLQKEYPDQKIAIIKYSRGGSSLQEGASGFGTWAPDFEEGNGINQYDNFLKTLNNALAVRDIDGDGTVDKLIPAGIVWMQGEADAGKENSALVYEANLKRTMDLIRAAFRTDDLPVVIGKIADSGEDEKDGKMMDFIEHVHRAQENFVKKDGHAILVSSTENYGFIKDKWHYTSRDYIHLGEEFARAILRLHDQSVLSEPVIYENEQITGTVFSHRFHSSILNNTREIFVWIPEDYNSSGKNYPLLVLHDGKSVFRSGGGFGGNEWHMDESVTELINSNEIEPLIMVGVSNTRNRGLEYVPMKRGESYGEALTRELLPELLKLYRISSDRIATMGASAGGLISFYLGWELNSTFSMAACLSPGLIFRDEDYVVELKKARIPQNLKLAIVNGTDDFDSNLQHGVNECIAYLEEINFPDEKLLYWVAEGGSHSAKSWAEQSRKIVKWMYPKNTE